MLQHLDYITVGDRVRQKVNPKKLQELIESIKEIGLINPITIDTNSNIIAGYRRFLACKHLHEENIPFRFENLQLSRYKIPVIVIPNITEVLHASIELAENDHREDFTVAERADAVARLHARVQEELKQQEKQENTELVQRNAENLFADAPLEAPTPPADSKQCTAAVIAQAQGRETTQRDVQDVIDNLLVNEYKDSDAVKNAATTRIAVRNVKKMLQAELGSALFELEQSRKSKPSKPVNKWKDQIIQGDCKLILPTLPNGLFDGVVVDPPYGISAENFGPKTFSVGHQYDDSREAALQIVRAIFHEGARVCKPDAHLYLFADLWMGSQFLPLALEAGWKAGKYPIIWDKGTVGHSSDPKRFYKHCYECIYYYYRGDRFLNRVISDVIKCPQAIAEKMHPAHKPAELLSELLSVSFSPGDWILDPCIGSGNTAKAARSQRIHITGIELDPTWVAYANTFLGQDNG